MPNIDDIISFLFFVVLPHRNDVPYSRPMIRKEVGDGYMLPWVTK